MKIGILEEEKEEEEERVGSCGLSMWVRKGMLQENLQDDKQPY